MAEAAELLGAPAPGDESVPVTVVVSRRIKPGREAEYEHWVRGVGEVAGRFPGHQGINVIRPRDKANPEYVLIFRFDHYYNLKRWTESTERAEWVARVAPLCEAAAKIEVLTGLEAWFTLPDKPPAPPPPRYKMALLTFGVIFPLSSFVAQPLGAALSRVLPPLLASLLLMAATIAAMTYVIMPRVTRLFYGWLYKR
jgi:uncharacterized protein